MEFWKRKTPQEKEEIKDHVKVSAGALAVTAAFAGAVEAAKYADKDIDMPKHAMPGAIAQAPDISPTANGVTTDGYNPNGPTVTIDSALVREGMAGSDHEEINATPAEMAEEKVVVTPVEESIHQVTLDEQVHNVDAPEQ